MKTIKIPKDLYKDINFTFKLVKHSKEEYCFCVGCIESRNFKRTIIETLVK